MNLSSGKKIEFEKVRKFEFSGESSSWIALQKYPPEGQAGEQRRASAPSGPAAAAPREERASGTDLILHELASSNDLSIGNVSEFSFDKKGRLMAWIVDAQDKSGNGVQLRNMSTGVVVPLDSDKAVYRRLSWTEKGDALLDYTVRMSEFFDHYLKGKPAPKWLKEGIPHLKMNEHIKEQSKKAKKQKSPREK